MRHYSARYLFLTFLLVFSCSDNDPVNNGPEDPGPDTQLALSDYFPNLTVNEPLDIQHAHDGTDKLYALDQNGIIVEFDMNPDIDSSIFLDITGRVFKDGEMGLLGLAFHPDYETNGYFYLYYCPNQNTSRISRFSFNSSTNMADPDSELELISIPQEQTNHNGGQLLFGNDGYLYISSGDGGNRQNGQDLSNLKGAILRIDVNLPASGLNYGIPADNPFIDDDQARDEIYAYGLRNPWRMSMDRTTGDLWLGDVGSGYFEEVNKVENGGNYGWADLEGSSRCFIQPCDNPDFIPPFYEYEHIDNLTQAITGGYVYRGNDHPELFGKYIYADYAQGQIWALDITTASNELLFDTDFFISSFGVDRENELYFTARGQKKIIKFVRQEIP